MTNQASLKIQVNNQDMFNQSTIKDDNHQNNPMEKWVEELGQYEKMLEGVTRANLASGYKEELGAVENWFDALEEGERTATMYTLIHKSNPILVRFLITVLQRIAKTQEQSRGLPTFSDYSRPNSATPSLVPTLKHSSSNSDSSSDFSAGTPSDLTSFMMKNKDIGNTSSSQFLSKPSTPSFSSRKFKFGGLSIKTPGSWGQNELKSPLLHPKSAVFPRESAWQTKFKSQPLKSPAFPPGLTHPTAWTPTNVHFPTTPSPATIKSSTPTSSPSAPSPTATPDPVDFDLLTDIPRWLRSLRLHKYTHLFTEMTWKEMIILTDQQLADKGVAALGARRKFLKVFDNVQSEARRLGYTAPPLIVTTDSSSDSQLTSSDASGDDQPLTRYRI